MEMLTHHELMNQLHEKIRELESDNGDGFDRYIRAMMAGQLPRPQTGSWD
jgi:hypothetical protein